MLSFFGILPLNVILKKSFSNSLDLNSVRRFQFTKHGGREL